MGRFQYKTKGMASPQGKQKVYFCAHPQDHAIYFDAVSDEILSHVDCAVWYDSTPEAERDEEFFFDLKGMQLFVMPVTTRLLTTENAALDTEFAFAVENHIPVLPLMQEGGLETLFNKKCGDLQFLDKSAADPTAISYEEKLKKFLSGVLVGDELAEKVRNAFDAYVFLSYRKKDRMYANELMRLIHKNDFCRDIAIWYDEFLTPGENFNDAIAKALDKSDLFALVVTPNLINEKNYVMTTEYPMAKKADKTVVSAELQATDLAALKECYPDVPDPVDARSEALSAALLQAVQGIALRENDGDDEHNFFIGLAYLSGIDVEVDKERALGLITRSAENGLIQAMEKLVSIYKTGEGVTRDYHASVKWQERLVEALTARYEESGKDDDADALFSALRDCGDDYQALGMLSAAKGYYIRLAELGKKRSANVMIAIGYMRLGDIAVKQGDIEGAKKWYEMFAELSEDFDRKVASSDSRHLLSISYGKLGDIYRSEGNIPAAKKWYEKSREIMEQIAADTETLNIVHDLSICFNQMGDVTRLEGDLVEAKKWYLRGLKLSESLSEGASSEEVQCDLCVSYDRLGIISTELGELAEAKEWFEKLLYLAKKRAEELCTVESFRNLSGSYERLGNIACEEGDPAAARMWNERSLKLREQLVRETGMVESRRDLSESYEKLGNIARGDGDLAGAKAWQEKSLVLREELAKETGTVDSLSDLLRSYALLGDISNAAGDLAGAKAWYEKALELAERLAKETGTVEDRRYLSVSCGRLGDIALTEDDLAGAKAWYEKSLELDELLVRETETLRSYSDLALSCSRLGVLTDDKALLQKAYDIYEALVKQCPGVARYAQIRDIVAGELAKRDDGVGKPAKEPSNKSKKGFFGRLADLFKGKK